MLNENGSWNGKTCTIDNYWLVFPLTRNINKSILLRVFHQFFSINCDHGAIADDNGFKIQIFTLSL